MPAKPSLLIVSQSYVPKENQKKLWALAEHFDLVCVTATAVQSMGIAVALSASRQEQPFKLVGLKTLGDPLSGTKFIFLGLRKALREHPADIILVESEPWALLRWQTWWLQRRYQPGALFAEYSAEDLDRPGWKGWALNLIYRAAIATSDFVIAISETGAALFRKRGVGRRILVSNQLGVDEQLFSPPSPEQRSQLRGVEGFTDQDFVIGFCGRFIEQKGVLDLVAAVELARKRMHAPRILLLMLGRGPLENRLRELGKGRPWLTFLPPRRHDEIAAFMQMLDLLVLPSKPWFKDGECWQEQLGHVLIEATACSTPCLGSASGEIPNVIGDPEALFPPGDVAALAERLEYWISDPAKRAALAARQRARTLATYTNVALAEKWSAALKRQLLAERRSVLWVDPHIEWRSPSMRHPMFALDVLKKDGWEVRAWCFESDLRKDEVEAHLWRSPNLPAGLPLIWFFIRANLARWAWLILKRRKPAAIVHSTGGFYLGADLVSVHFVNALWTKMQMKLGFRSWKQVAQWALSLIGVFMDYCQFRHPRSGRFLCVSDSIAEAVRELVHPGAAVEVLPNGYDETRFNPAVRERWRAPMREKLGFATEDAVFAFVSAGHYERKGFWLAADALALVRSRGQRKDLKFLVIGGAESALAALRSELQERHPGFSEWIIFVGQQPKVEVYLAAADAFLYPSYFEAFCLAEIEAAAMGIPLLITRHYGSEMVLKEGINGLSLEWDHRMIAEKMLEFLSLDSKTFRLDTGSALTRAQYAQKLLEIYVASLSDARA